MESWSGMGTMPLRGSERAKEMIASRTTTLSFNTRRFSIVKLLYLGIVAALTTSCAVVTPRDETFGAMLATFQRIGRYARDHGQLPASLAELPKPERHEQREFDPWGRVLHYEVDRNGIVSLTSFGRDGKPGGRLWNADFTMRYYSRRPD